MSIDPPSSGKPSEFADSERFLQRLAQGMLQGSDGVEDAVQDSHVRVLVSGGASRGGGRGWLAAILRNVIRSRARRRELETDALLERSRLLPDGEPSAEEEAARAEVRRLVVQAVEELDEPYRAVLRARYFDGLTPSEAAASLECSVNTVQTRSRRAIGRLRQRLDRQLGAEGYEQHWPVLLLPIGAGASGATGAGGPGLNRESFEDHGAGALDGAGTNAGRRGRTTAGRWWSRAPWIAVSAVVVLVASLRPDSENSQGSATEVDSVARVDPGVRPPEHAVPTPLEEGRSPIPSDASTLEPDVQPAPAGSELRRVTVRVHEPNDQPIQHAAVIALRDLSLAEQAELAPLGINATSVGEMLGRANAEGELEVELDGRFAIHPEILEGGEWLALRAELPGYSGAHRLHYVRFPAEDGVRVDLELLPGGVEVLAQVVTPEGHGVESYVMFGTANPVAVESSRDRVVLDNPGTAQTDGSGNVSLQGLPGGLVPIRAVAPGYGPIETFVDTRSGGVIECELKLRPPARLSGVVIGLDGMPEPRAMVSIEFMARGGGAHRRRHETATDGDGRFEFIGLPPGRLWLCAAKPEDPSLCVARSFDIEPGGQFEWTAYMERDSGTGFRVMDSAGEPVPGAFVSFDSAERDWNRSVFTDDQGEAVFRGIPGERFDARIYRETVQDQMSLVPDAERTRIQAGEWIEVVLPDPPPPIRVRGRLETLEAGRLPTGRLVVLEADSAYQRSIELDIDGAFAFEGRAGAAGLHVLLDGWGCVDLGKHFFEPEQSYDLGTLSLPIRKRVQNTLLEPGNPQLSPRTRIMTVLGDRPLIVSPEIPAAQKLFLLHGDYRLGEVEAGRSDWHELSVE